MAELNKKILGELKGVVGDIVFRKRGGKNYISSRPSSMPPTNDPKVLERRARFALAVKLASTINSIPGLKEVWENDTPGTAGYNLMVKENYPRMEADNVTDLAKLMPQMGFGVTATTVSISNSNIQVDLEPLGPLTGIDTVKEPEMKLVSVLYLKDPLDENVDKHEFIPFVSVSQSTSVVDPLSFSIQLSSRESKLFDQYQTAKGLFVLVTNDADSNVVHFSNTFTGS